MERAAEPQEFQPMDVIYALLLVITTVDLDVSVRAILLDHALSIAADNRSCPRIMSDLSDSLDIK